MGDETAATWACPKDGATMAQMGRRSGAWRCPTCRGIFIDTERMRHGRRGQPSIWQTALMSLFWGWLAMKVVRRLLHRSARRPSAARCCGDCGALDTAQ
jgi:hypothetical protein